MALKPVITRFLTGLWLWSVTLNFWTILFAAATKAGAALALVEEMVTDGVAEVLVGMTVDSQFGQLLVLGAGGVLTELLRDSVTLLPPFDAAGIERALRTLRVARLLGGFRGRPAGLGAVAVDALIRLAEEP